MRGEAVEDEGVGEVVAEAGVGRGRPGTEVTRPGSEAMEAG